MAGTQQEELLELMFAWALQIPPFIDFVERQFSIRRNTWEVQTRSTPTVSQKRIPKKCSSCLEATGGSGSPTCDYYRDKAKGGNCHRKSTPRIGKYSYKSLIGLGLAINAEILDQSSLLEFCVSQVMMAATARIQPTLEVKSTSQRVRSSGTANEASKFVRVLTKV
jgi:hypothetical protein